MKRSTWILLAVVAALLGAIFLWERGQPTTGEREEGKGKLCDLSVTEVTGLRRAGDTPVRLLKDSPKEPGGDVRWSLIEPVKDAADRYAVEGFVERIAQTRAVRFPGAGIPLQEMGLDKPRAVWEIQGDKGATKLELGAKAAFDEGLYVRINGKAALVPADLEPLLLRPPDEFRLRNLTTAATQEIQSFDLEGADGRRLGFKRDGKGLGWDVTAPFGDWGTTGEIERALDDVSLCLVDTFLEGAGLDRAAAGLDPPRVRIRIGSSLGPAVELALGGAVPGSDPAKNLVYATVSGRPSVMTVSANSLKSLDTDAESLRSLKLFRRDAFEASELRVDGPRKLVLRRDEGGSWNLEGKAPPKGGSDLAALPVALMGLTGEKAVPWMGAQTSGLEKAEFVFTLKGEGFAEKVSVGPDRGGQRLAHPEGRPVALLLPAAGWKTLETALKIASGQVPSAPLAAGAKAP